jgi:hypothetical protein
MSAYRKMLPMNLWEGKEFLQQFDKILKWTEKK